MNQIPIWVLFVSLLFLSQTSRSVEDDVKTSLINFLAKLSPAEDLGWDLSSDPCNDNWEGISCDIQNITIKRIILDHLNLSGTLEFSSLCSSEPVAASLAVLSLNGNGLTGMIPVDISNCTKMTHLYFSFNKFYGNLPGSLAMLSNLKHIDISNNNLSGNLPDLSRISGLTIFCAQNNKFNGEIPQFDFSNLDQFNVSFNNLSGPIPFSASRFSETNYMGNPNLCGDPLPQNCSLTSFGTHSVEVESKGLKHNADQILMYSGYAIFGLVIIVLIIFRLCKRRKEEKEVISVRKVASIDDSSYIQTPRSSLYKTSREEYSMYSAESKSMIENSTIVLTSPVVNGLKFEDLLKAPAELLGRGKHGSLYKVLFENRMTLVVKRIKDWAISSDDFVQRMWRIYRLKHPRLRVLPALAFYSNMEEKLLVYEYQPNGSLFKLLHGIENKQPFDWTNRLSVAATIANALAFMHQELREDGIAHGNLKSTNILLDRNMEACISEYGLMEINNQDTVSTSRTLSVSRPSATNSFKEDVYGFGLILLELLTGKVAHNDGVDLAEWVNSVVREEWTAEVFDKALFYEGASEERMLNLLQVAIQCVNEDPGARPSMDQVAAMIGTIRDEDEKSMATERSIVSEQ